MKLRIGIVGMGGIGNTHARVYKELPEAEIVALGPDFPADRGFSVGDRVCVDLVINCGACYPCRVGRPNCCVNIKVMGVHVDGGMADNIRPALYGARHEAVIANMIL
jgi:threonine dehydrogenase-like Zn-dependent dehydrogenase